MTVIHVGTGFQIDAQLFSIQGTNIAYELIVQVHGFYYDRFSPDPAPPSNQNPVIPQANLAAVLE
jgi:hypothetical protein